MRLRGEVVIDRPADEVFDLLAHRLFDTFHLWNTGVLEVRPLTSGPVAVGSRGVALEYVRRGKSKYREEGATFEVVGLVEGAELVLAGTDSSPRIDTFRSTVRFFAEGARTRVVVETGLAWANEWVGFARPFVWVRRSAELASSLRRLKRALESGSPLSPPTRPE